EYEAGVVICAVCGSGVSFRDDAAGTFTVKHWEAHREACRGPPAPGMLVFAPPNTTSSGTALSYPAPSSGPPAKRRRAKRTEEERIEYLRADAHVAQFEAYRVLCASCDKWIRLRPNSTYCSIPWDAHRKSCLAKKTNAKNIYALDERNALFTKDPDVRKFDAERLLCGMCDKWVTIPTDDHLGAVQTWLSHRGTCQKTPVVSPPPSAGAGPSSYHPHHHPHSAPPHNQSGHQPAHARSSGPSSHAPNTHPPPPPPSSHPPPPTHLPLPDAPHLVLDLSPANYAAPHESRRRNAEQRAATLRADVLIREVEPNRVFCSLCAKWVQLRQDSSYCAYPWLQHRGKCLARYQRRAQKASEIASFKAKRPSASSGAAASAPHPSSPESEEGVERSAARRPRRAAPPAHPPRAIPAGYVAARPLREWSQHQAQQQQGHHQQHSQGEEDGEGEADADGEDVDAEGEAEERDAEGDSASAILRRAVPATLADLDSPAGRRAFIFASVEYLFRTTHEASDDLSVSALLAYLTAALPADKHEDFDTGEVVRGVSALAAR
ncbi:hypothetical protein FB451DRAFT_1521045, partial [Mycena latifolia]